MLTFHLALQARSTADPVLQTTALPTSIKEDPDSRDLHDGSEPEERATEFESSETHLHSYRPLFVMSNWRDPKTRDGRVAIFILLPSGILEKDNSVRAVVVGAMSVSISFTWPSALLQAERLMTTMT